VSEQKLKLWNGRWFKHQHLYIAAYSQKDAVGVVAEVFPTARFTLHEIQTYFSPCWGNSMKGVTPERGVWVQTDDGVPERQEAKVAQ
jgi:hypothetical protein